jgi:hypothetical protein
MDLGSRENSSSKCWPDPETDGDWANQIPEITLKETETDIRVSEGAYQKLGPEPTKNRYLYFFQRDTRYTNV